MTAAFEIREGDGTLQFSGYASVTDTWYDVGFYSETIKRGAFRRSLSQDPDTTLLLNHAGLPLARTRPNQTLRLNEDNHGLYVEADLDPEDPDVVAIARKLKRGDLDGQMSFAFRATSDSWNEDFTERTIKGVDIHRGDVSIVTQGANPATSGGIRADTLNLEPRRRRVAEIGTRVTGGNARFTLNAAEGVRSVARSRVYIPDFTTRARQDFDLMCARIGYTPKLSAPKRPPATRDYVAEARRDLDRLRRQASRKPAR